MNDCENVHLQKKSHFLHTSFSSKVKQASFDNLVALDTCKVHLLASSFCTWLLEEEFHQGGKTSNKCNSFSADPVHWMVC